MEEGSRHSPGLTLALLQQSTRNVVRLRTQRSCCRLGGTKLALSIEEQFSYPTASHLPSPSRSNGPPASETKAASSRRCRSAIVTRSRHSGTRPTPERGSHVSAGPGPGAQQLLHDTYRLAG